MTVNFRRTGVTDPQTSDFQSNVEQAFHDLNDEIESAPVKLYGSFITVYHGEPKPDMDSQEADGFTIFYDKSVGGQTGNVPNVNLILVLDIPYKKLLNCTVLISGTVYDGSGEAIAVHYVSDNIAEGGKEINLATVGVDNTRALENGKHFIEITLLK